MNIDWDSIFDEARRDNGATDSELTLLGSSLRESLNSSELRSIAASQMNPFPKGDPLYESYRAFDPSLWVLPQQSLPPSYLSLLKWSNGGWCRTGEREFGYFGTTDIREMLIAYHLPQYMPHALPFAFNGGGVFYLFDMRESAKDGEFPVVCSHAGNLGWSNDECYRVADTFIKACRGRSNVERLMT